MNLPYGTDYDQITITTGRNTTSIDSAGNKVYYGTGRFYFNSTYQDSNGVIFPTVVVSVNKAVSTTSGVYSAQVTSVTGTYVNICVYGPESGVACVVDVIVLGN